MGIEASGLDNLIAASYSLLGLISLPDRRQEGMPRLDHQARAPRPPRPPARSTPTFERGFIRARGVQFRHTDGMRRQHERGEGPGPVPLEGKEYVVQDGDIIEFLFNV